ncbi:hypothetical protein BH20ACT5_BH20ACT5_01450 [soil metagenome]
MSEPGGAKRGQVRVADMVRSLLPLLIGVLAMAWFCTPQDSDPVREVDPAPSFGYAADLADFTVLAPIGLPEGWRATSARVEPAEPDGPVGVLVGYVTPAEEFAQLVHSSVPIGELLDATLGTGYGEEGERAIAGQDWRTLRTVDGELALVRADSTATVVITGSADQAELELLAASLRPLEP